VQVFSDAHNPPRNSAALALQLRELINTMKAVNVPVLRVFWHQLMQLLVAVPSTVSQAQQIFDKELCATARPPASAAGAAAPASGLAPELDQTVGPDSFSFAIMINAYAQRCDITNMMVCTDVGCLCGRVRVWSDLSLCCFLSSEIIEARSLLSVRLPCPASVIPHSLLHRFARVRLCCM
jgi:hypothetical protein